MYSKEKAHELRREFWTSFSNYTQFYAKKVGEPIQWMLYKSGIKGMELKFDVENKQIAVVLEINAKDPDRRFDMFVELDTYKKIIEADFPRELRWEEDYLLPEGKIVSRIYTEQQGLNYHNPDKWPDIFRFMAENMFLLQRNFIDVLPILDEKFGK